MNEKDQYYYPIEPNEMAEWIQVLIDGAHTDFWEAANHLGTIKYGDMILDYVPNLMLGRESRQYYVRKQGEARQRMEALSGVLLNLLLDPRGGLK